MLGTNDMMLMVTRVMIVQVGSPNHYNVKGNDMSYKVMVVVLAVAAIGLPLLLANLGPNHTFTPFFKVLNGG